MEQLGVKNARKAFDEIDTDNSGLIDATELKNLLKKLKLSNDMVEKISQVFSNSTRLTEYYNPNDN